MTSQSPVYTLAELRDMEARYIPWASDPGRAWAFDWYAARWGVVLPPELSAVTPETPDSHAPIKTQAAESPAAVSEANPVSTDVQNQRLGGISVGQQGETVRIKSRGRPVRTGAAAQRLKTMSGLSNRKAARQLTLEGTPVSEGWVRRQRKGVSQPENKPLPS